MPRPRPVDLALAVVLAVALQVHLAIDRYGDARDIPFAIALTVPLALRSVLPAGAAVAFAVVAALDALAGGAIFEGRPPAPPALLAGALLAYAAGAQPFEPRARSTAAAMVTGLWIAVAATDLDVQGLLFSAGLVVAVPWLLGRAARLRDQRQSLFVREQHQRELAAVAEERARIARELHDVVAHSVGAMVLQAQGAQAVLDRDPDRAREALGHIEQTGRLALQEVRRSLGMLRHGDASATRAPQPGLDGLDALVADAGRTGLQVTVRREGTPRPLPAAVDLAAFRIVQEALTNARRHGGPVAAEVVVRYRDDAVELQVADEGPVAVGAVAEAGHGLLGMRERAAVFGGRLDAGPRPGGGYEVRAVLPWTP